MRFNEFEAIANLALSRPELEGKLRYKSSKGSGFSLGSNRSNNNEYKERWFRLRANCLFYWRINDRTKEKPSLGADPLGMIILENSHVQQEGFAESKHAFSIMFNGDTSDKKHMFLCDSSLQIQQWITSIKLARYEVLRTKLINLQIKIIDKTNKNPLLGTGFDCNPAYSIQVPDKVIPLDFSSNIPKPKPRKIKAKSTFQSHIANNWQDISTSNGSVNSVEQNQDNSEEKSSLKSHIPVDKLIDL